MAFSMVANHIDSKITVGDLAKSLVKLKLTENKKHTKNMVEWDEALRAVYSTNDLAIFINKFYGIQVPSSLVPKGMLEGQVKELLKVREAQLKAAKGALTTQGKQVIPFPPLGQQPVAQTHRSNATEYRRSMRLREKRNVLDTASKKLEEVKEMSSTRGEIEEAEADEKAAIDALDDELERQADEIRRETAAATQQQQQALLARTTATVNTPAPVIRDAKLQKEFEEEMLKNAREIMADQVNEDSIAEKRGNRSVSYFANPLLKFEESKRHLFGAEYLIEWPKGSGKEYYYCLEDKTMRKKRHIAWQLLVNSLSNLSSAIWRHVPIGDVHALYTLITTRYDDQDRTDVVEKLNNRLNKLEKFKSELYATFLGRYEQLIIEMKEVQFEIDTDVMKHAVMRAHERSSDEMLKSTYDIVTAMLLQQNGGSDAYTVDELLNMMRAMMVTKERAAGKQDRQDGASRAQKLREKREKEKALKAAARATANAARADLAPLPDHLKNVCVDYNLNKCLRGNACRWKHDKKSAADVAVLQEYVQQKVSQRKARAAKDAKDKSKLVCYGCGQEGHIKPKCPQREKANVTKPADAKAIVNTASTIISDSQVGAFAEALIKFSQRQAEK